LKKQIILLPIKPFTQLHRQFKLSNKPPFKQLSVHGGKVGINVTGTVVVATAVKSTNVLLTPFNL
jgi:hypothetical protein